MIKIEINRLYFRIKGITLFSLLSNHFIHPSNDGINGESKLSKSTYGLRGFLNNQSLTAPSVLIKNTFVIMQIHKQVGQKEKECSSEVISEKQKRIFMH